MFKSKRSYETTLIWQLSILLEMQYFIVIAIFIMGISACSEPTNSVKSLPKQEKELPENVAHLAQKIKQQRKCKVQGELLEENERWIKDQAKLVCIIGDSSTYDSNYGFSHRILEVYDTYTCELDLKLTLPVNESPDFPYYLADINYNNGSKIVAIKAARSVYCLDLATKKMMPVLMPQFKTKRLEVDATTGQIIRLELWENYLIGYAQDKGTFVFDLSTAGKGIPVLPFAEYRTGETNFNALFLLPSGSDKFQAILPHYDWEEEVFAINPIFKEPLKINTNLQKSALNNQYLVLKQTELQEAMLIDMKARKNRPLPTELVNESVKTILAWAKANF